MDGEGAGCLVVEVKEGVVVMRLSGWDLVAFRP